MNELIRPFRLAVRRLARTPGFTFVAVAVLALGIGANTAVFSVARGVFLTALPFEEPEDLVFITTTVQREQEERRGTTYPDFLDWREGTSAFTSMAAYDLQSLAITGEGEPERLLGELAGAGYFELLGVRARVGRLFTPAEAAGSGDDRVAVISHSLWQDRFGGRARVVGTGIRLNEQVFTIVGVLPEGFRGLTDTARIWVPFSVASITRGEGILESRGARWHNVAARLAPGVTLEQAQADLELVTSRLQEEYPGTNTDYSARALPLRGIMLGNLAPMTGTLASAVLLVLLLVATNLAHLMLARSSARRRETAIHLAMGSGRGRLVAQHLAEGTVLAAVGGLAGVLLALWGVDGLTALIPASLPSFVEAAVDVPVMLFTLGVSILAGILASLGPSLQVSRHETGSALRRLSAGSGQAESASGFRTGGRGVLVAAEVALAVILLAGAALMVRSFGNQVRIDPGFQPEDLAIMSVQLPASRYDSAGRRGFAARLDERLAGLPGEARAAISSDVPIADGYSATYLVPEAAAGDSLQARIRAYVHLVRPGFFQTLGIPLLRGRAIEDRDGQPGGIPGVVVSRKYAEKAWPGEDPVGRTAYVGGEGGLPLQVVGMVGDVRYRTLTVNPVTSPEDPDFYIHWDLRPPPFLRVSVRTDRGTEAAIAAVRGIVTDMDPELPVFASSAMADVLSGALALSRFGTFLITSFGLAALLLAVLGLYGVISFSVGRRTREIGIRMALGAEGGDVLRMVMGQGMGLVAAGVGIGLLGAWLLVGWAEPYLSDVLYQTSTHDPVSFLTVTLILSAACLAGILVPARRAARLDPMGALRYE